ncbi:hypothetical protein WJX72_007114 [[Myrmecia] bisecta]|uniref:Uncharacterized protein n=1 Tax=[Myrmecia] bisecta TaxID=41462 RepID=A0AAW1Q7K2_9CHLO
MTAQAAASAAGSVTVRSSPSVFSYKEPWTATYWEILQLFSFQLAGVGGAAAIAKTVVAPLSRAQILLQVQPLSNTPVAERYTGLRDALWRIPREEGLLALYRGNGANVMRIVPEVAFKFFLNDQFKVAFAPGDGYNTGLLARMGAGAATAVVHTAMFYPLELTRTRLAADTAGRGRPRAYRGVIDCLLKTYRFERIPGLYKGMMASAVGVVPYMAVSLTAWDGLKQCLPTDKLSRQAWWFPFAQISCGIGAGLAAQVMCYPIDTVRRRMQLTGSRGVAAGIQYYHLTGYRDCLVRMARLEGVSSFYRGLGINCLKTVPGAAIQFVAYDHIKYKLLNLDSAAASSALP